MITFDELWSLLRGHGSSGKRAAECAQLWERYSPEVQQLLCERIRTKLQQGKFVQYKTMYIGFSQDLHRTYIGHAQDLIPIRYLQTIKNKRIMAKKRSKEEERWKKAHRQAAQMGIVLTRRKDSKGEYVCYLDRRSKKGWLSML